MKKFIFLWPMILFSLDLDAHSEKKFTAFLRQNAAKISAALNEEASGNWELKNFYLRLTSTVGFHIFYFARIRVEPHVELVWHRIED